MPGHPAPNGRWQRGEELAGLYLAHEPDTVWAEWYRALAELGLPPDTRLPRDLWRFSVNLKRVADLSRRAALRAIGLPTRDLIAGSGRRSRTSAPSWPPKAVWAYCFGPVRAPPAVRVRVRIGGWLSRRSAAREPRADHRRTRAAARDAHLSAVTLRTARAMRKPRLAAVAGEPPTSERRALTADRADQ